MRHRFALLTFIYLPKMIQNQILNIFIVENTSIALFKLWDKNTPPSDPIVFVGSSSIRKGNC